MILYTKICKKYEHFGLFNVMLSVFKIHLKNVFIQFYQSYSISKNFHINLKCQHFVITILKLFFIIN